MRVAAIGILALMTLLAAGCAKQARPPGGPVDRTAPTVIDHSPAADAASVPASAIVTIDFSEAMDRQRVEQAVFVAPRVEIDMEWSGRQLRIQPRGGLTAGRTYVVTVGTDGRDLRGHRLEDSFHLAFATGEQLDSGELEGRIIGANNTPQRGAYVWAYDLASFDGRTATDDPAYVTQTGTDGTYRFERLARGQYRVIGFVDGNRNQQPDFGEPLALPSADVDVAGQGATAAGDQRLARRQVQPAVVRASAVTGRRVLVVFDRAVQVDDLDIEMGGLSIESIYRDPADAERIHVRTSLQEEGHTYSLRVRRSGIDLETEDVELRGTARQDSKAPRVVRVEPTGDVASAPRVNVIFSEAMDTTRAVAGWTGVDSTSSPDGEWIWRSETSMTFTPDTLFAPGLWHMELSLLGLQDLAGLAPDDSSAAVTFDLLPTEALATITGVSLWPDEVDGRARIRLEAVAGGMAAMADSTGSFRFDSLAPGKYSVSAWLDRNEDGDWDAGQLEDPYREAEPFVLHGDVQLEQGDTMSLALPLPPAPPPVEVNPTGEAQ